MKKRLLAFILATTMLFSATACSKDNTKKGETQKLYDEWLEKCKGLVAKSSLKQFKAAIYNMVDDDNEFDAVAAVFENMLEDIDFQ